MYLHLGQAVVVPFHDVIGVFDLDITSQSHLTRGFLERAERERLAERAEAYAVFRGLSLKKLLVEEA